MNMKQSVTPVLIENKRMTRHHYSSPTLGFGFHIRLRGPKEVFTVQHLWLNPKLSPLCSLRYVLFSLSHSQVPTQRVLVPNKDLAILRALKISQPVDPEPLILHE